MHNSKKELTPTQQKAVDGIIREFCNPNEARIIIHQTLSVISFAVQGIEENVGDTDSTIGLMRLLTLCSRLNQLAEA